MESQSRVGRDGERAVEVTLGVSGRWPTVLGVVRLGSGGAVTTERGGELTSCAPAAFLLLVIDFLLVVRSKYVVQILPSMVVAPVFFKGNMEMGAISQT